MKIQEIKTAINNVLLNNGQRVYSNETDEGFDKPAFFVRVIPVSHNRISPVYEEVGLSVELQYESAVKTDEDLILMQDNIDKWFAVPFPVGDRMIKPPEDIEHTTENSKVLYSSFPLSITRVFNEDGYDGTETTFGELKLNMNI